MAIPGPSAFEQPILRELQKAGGAALSGGLFRSILSNRVVYGLNVTDDDLLIKEPSGGRKVEHRFHTELQTLKRKGLVVRLSNGRWSLKERLTPPSPLPPDDFPGCLLARLLELSPAKFEQLVGKVLEAKGLANIKVTGRPGDRGIDGEAKAAFLNTEIAFQAKRYDPTNNIGYQDVAAFKGSLSARGFSRGVLITTSSFTPGAEEAAEQGEPKIVLVNGNDLVAMLTEHNIGVVKVPVIETKIDDGFFNSL